jgi:hypothetical protein
MTVYVCLLFCSCASSVDVLKPTGDQATVTLRDSTKHRVELLGVSDSVLYVVEGGAISSLRLSDVQNVYIHGYRISERQRTLGAIPVLLLQGIAAYSAFVATEGSFGAGLFASGSLICTALGFATGAGEPDISFSHPFDENRLQKLRLYSRYPQGLTVAQWSRLLAFHGQMDFVPTTPR